MDELIQLEKDLHESKNNLTVLARQMKASARAEVESRSCYEEKKNIYLIQLYNQEAETGSKRTEKMREAMYRNEFKVERREWLFAKADADSDRDLFRGLMSKIEALRTLVSVEKSRMNL